MSTKGWIGCDLDGTLAFYDGWVDATHVGKPIPKMVERVKKWIDDGWTVKIFTARVAETDEIKKQRIVLAIRDYCLEHVGVILPITNVKDMNMVCLYDDRCVQVVPNTGKLVGVQE